MPDQDPTSDAARRTLSEISHLFLSDVRDRQTDGAARPRRTPPGGHAPAEPVGGTLAEAREPAQAPSVTAVLGAHLGGGQFDRVKQYARHLAGRVGRVGLIELDGDELRLLCYEAAADARDDAREGGGADGMDEAGGDFESEVDEPRAAAEAIEEMSWDVRRWLVLVSQPRQPEAQALLAGVNHWVLLSTCDHDGVVSSYRTLKALSDLPRSSRPRLTLSLLDADNEPEMVRVYRKLAGVAEQFLNWPVEPEPAVRSSPGVNEHRVLRDRPAESAPAGGVANFAACTSPHWTVVSDFLARHRLTADQQSGGPSRPGNPDASSDIASNESADGASIDSWPDELGEPDRKDLRAAPAGPRLALDREMPSTYAPPNIEAVEAPRSLRLTPSSAPKPANDRAFGERHVGAPTDHDASRGDESEVLDLSGSDDSVEAILTAILGRRDGGLVECPVRAPMCTSARLAIGRDRRVVLLAVAREGLSELRSIGQAYRWLVENRALIGMAVPQLAIDINQEPGLRLLVNHADVSADLLQPILHAGHVTVQAYRRVRWGGRTGLLLDAA